MGQWEYCNISFICNGKCYQNISNYEQFVHNLSRTKVIAILSLQYLQKWLVSQINKNAVLYLQHYIKNTEKCIFINVLLLQYPGGSIGQLQNKRSGNALEHHNPPTPSIPFPQSPLILPYPFPILYIPSIYSILLSSIFISSNF